MDDAHASAIRAHPGARNAGKYYDEGAAYRRANPICPQDGFYDEAYRCVTRKQTELQPEEQERRSRAERAARGRARAAAA